MTGGDGFEVLHGSLDNHAGSLDGLTERLRSAVDAAKQVSMSDDAYGIICRPFAWLLKPVENGGTNALQGAVDAMEATAGGVRATTKAYQDVESENASSFKGGG
jgi:hypothetical protein